MKYDIFISYRREGGYDTAKHLNDLLVRDGYKVSFDIDTLRSGDFDKQLLNRIDECKDFILIVDTHAFDRTIDTNYDPQKDWLRCELAYALKQKKNIIPVFLSGVTGFPNDLPSDVADVIRKNGPEYNKYHFNAFYEDLKERFLTSKNQRWKRWMFSILSSSLLIVVAIFLIKNNNIIPRNTSFDNNYQSELSNESDTSRYYYGSFDERKLFIKGLKRGILYDAGEDMANNGETYTYKCGRVIQIKVFFDQVNIAFKSIDESGKSTYLDYDFENIGYEKSDKYGKYEFPDNQYIIGQHDIDGDGVDELIISVRTMHDEEYMADGTGIGINVFKLISGAWRRLAILNETTNILPAYAKIINNNVYIYWLRYDEQYSLVNGSFIHVDFYDRVFKDADFE